MVGVCNFGVIYGRIGMFLRRFYALALGNYTRKFKSKSVGSFFDEELHKVLSPVKLDFSPCSMVLGTIVPKILLAKFYVLWLENFSRFLG